MFAIWYPLPTNHLHIVIGMGTGKPAGLGHGSGPGYIIFYPGNTHTWQVYLSLMPVPVHYLPYIFTFKSIPYNCCLSFFFWLFLLSPTRFLQIRTELIRVLKSAKCDKPMCLPLHHLPLYSTPNARPSGHYLTLFWVSGKARSKERVGR